MPVSKVKWGGDWLDALENESDDEGAGYEPYEGPRPPKGVYLAKVRMQQSESSNGNDQVIVHFNLVGSWKPEHRRFDGYYWRDYLTFTEKTGFRTRPFLKALGVTPREFASQTGADENGTIRQIGKKKFTEEFYLVVGIRPDTKNNADYEQTRYLRTPSADELKGGAPADTSADALPEPAEDQDALPTPF
jgi:hypothetical protein